MINAVQSGQKVSVHYRGTLDDGSEFDNSRKRGEAMQVEVGSGQLIAGFDAALLGMTVGEVKISTLEPRKRMDRSTRVLFKKRRRTSSRLILLSRRVR